MGARSRRKGADGERELVRLARAAGLSAERTWHTAQSPSEAANSRAKNSRSWRYNLWTTLASSALYIASLLWIGNLVLQAKGSGQARLVLLAVALYATASALGSVAGQLVAMKLESRRSSRGSYVN